jgi:hypothetical protein
MAQMWVYIPAPWSLNDESTMGKKNSEQCRRASQKSSFLKWIGIWHVASHLKYNQKTSLKQAEAWQKPPVKHGQWTIPN